MGEPYSLLGEADVQNARSVRLNRDIHGDCVLQGITFTEGEQGGDGSNQGGHIIGRE